MKNFWLRKTFIGTLFAVLFVGELSFQIFTNGERTLVNLAEQEQAALDSVLVRADIRAEKSRAEKRAEPLERGKATYVELNRRAEGKKELFQPYSDKIVLADKQIDEAWRPYKELVAQRQDLIRAEFGQRRDNAESFLGLLTGIQYGVSASLLAIGLAFFSTVVYDRWRWILFAASFIAQYTACLMIYHGAMLKYSDERQATAFAAMFFFCAPLAFHFGTLLFGKERVGEPAMATVTTREHTESVELSRRKTMIERTEQVPVEQARPPVEKIELKPKNWQDACRMKYAGEIHLSIREIAGQFGAKKWEVEHMLNGLKNEKRLPSPVNRGVSESILS